MEVKKKRLIFANHMLLCLLFSYLIPSLMKPISSVIVFLLLVLSAVCTSIDSYRCAETAIVQDMNQALEKTLAAKREAWITPDTIQNYREHLRIKDLKSRSFVSYALEKNDYSLCSQSYQWQKGQHSFMFQSYADCSFGTIWGLSDQRLALFLTLSAMLWMLFSVVYWHRNGAGRIVFGSMTYVPLEHSFRDVQGKEIPFTPMQHQLMELFMASDDMKLSKITICESLWPKKPDASETLYTLIRRLKPVVSEHCGLTITAEKGGGYQLKHL